MTQDRDSVMPVYYEAHKLLKYSVTVTVSDSDDATIDSKLSGSSQSNRPKLNVKLPQLNLSYFDGTFFSWQPFQNKFKGRTSYFRAVNHGEKLLSSM